MPLRPPAWAEGAGKGLPRAPRARYPLRSSVPARSSVFRIRWVCVHDRRGASEGGSGSDVFTQTR
eukprot:1728828-Prymnesium_polylepis.1